MEIGHTITGTDVFMKLKRVQEFGIDEFSRRRLIENQDTVNELTSQLQELQNEVNCTNDSGKFQDVESIPSGQLFHVPSQPALFPSPRGKPGGLLSRDQSLRHDILNPHGISGSVFAGLHASASTPYTGLLNSWDSGAAGNISVQKGTGRLVAGNEEPDRDVIPTPKFARRSSAKNSFIPMEGRSLQKYLADQQRLQVSELHLNKFPTTSTFSCWKIRSRPRYVLVQISLRKQCCGSKKWRWSIQWTI